MQEELLIKIKADISDMKKGVSETKKGLSEAEKAAKDMQKKVDDNISKMGKGFQKLGNMIGNAIKAGCAIAVGAIAAIFKSSWDGYKDYEQLVGGMEKLYGDSASTMINYAKQAYAVTGQTANQYMETTTSFSAKLISELGGDQAKAAEIANMAVTDMADNVSIFGGSMDELTSVYVALSKEQYQTLDNLKLGYAGTKEGMKEMILEAERLDPTFHALRDTNGELVMSFEDEIQAIHIIQDEMGITGNSAEELSKTLQGSLNQMKGAWGNWVTSLMDDEADVSATTAALIDSVSTFVGNAIPRIKEFAEGLVTGIHDALEEYPALQEAFDTVVDVLTTVGNAVKETASFVIDNWNIIGPILVAVATAVGIIAGAVTLYNTVKGIKVALDIAETAALGPLIAALWAQATATAAALAPYIAIVAAIAAVIAIIVICVKHWDEIKEKVIEVWNAMKEKISETVENIKQKIEDFKTNIHNKFEEIKTAITEKITEAKEKVINLFNEIKQGIKDKIEETKNSVKEKFEEIKSAIRDKVNNAKDTVLTAFTNIRTGITDRIEGARSAVISKFEAIKSGIKEKIEAAREAVHNAIEKIKGFFKFEWSLPKLKMPHFSISGKFSLNPPSVPSIGVDWYARGGVFDYPSLFSYGNHIGGIGEDGAEAVVPLEKNTEWLSRIADMLNERQGGKQIVLTVDGKVFAQTAISSINNLTNQTGNLGLVIR